jgi:hypothetical protein
MCAIFIGLCNIFALLVYKKKRRLKADGLVRTGTLIKVAVLSYLHGPKPLIKRCSHAGE